MEVGASGFDQLGLGMVRDQFAGDLWALRGGQTLCKASGVARARTVYSWL